MENKKQENEENESGEKKNKLHSRKFIVWIVATVFQLGAILAAVIIKNSEIATDFFVWWGSISVGYIGGNVAQDFIFNRGKNDR